MSEQTELTRDALVARLYLLGFEDDNSFHGVWFNHPAISVHVTKKAVGSNRCGWVMHTSTKFKFKFKFKYKYKYKYKCNMSLDDGLRHVVEVLENDQR